MALLEARGLGVRLRTLATRLQDAIVVRDVDLVVETGECLGIVGESGSGKTTLARLLARLLVSTQGTLIFDGQDITHTPEAELRALRRRLRFVFQDSLAALNPRHRMERVLRQAMPSPATDPAAKALEDLLDTVGLKRDLLSRYPHELSGGQRQRLGLARALATTPDLIIADEVLSGQDASHRASLLVLLEQLKRGVALIIVSHDLGAVARLCDRICILHHGAVVEHGETRTVLGAPRHAQTRRLVGSIPPMRPTPDWIDSIAQPGDWPR